MYPYRSHQWDKVGFPISWGEKDTLLDIYLVASFFCLKEHPLILIHLVVRLVAAERQVVQDDKHYYIIMVRDLGLGLPEPFSGRTGERFGVM